MLNKDAFSSGQIGSKIWLCEELEKIVNSVDTIWIYGGWYGLTGFLLYSRNNIQIKEIRSIDIDPTCEAMADMINENWKWQDWKFKAVTMDCNTVVPVGVDVIINTSTEHFESMDWWNNIPCGTHVALQGNNMPHDDHIIHSTTLDSFVNQYPLTTYYFKGSKEFKYPTWEFTRYMTIGVK